MKKILIAAAALMLAACAAQPPASRLDLDKFAGPGARTIQFHNDGPGLAELRFAGKTVGYAAPGETVNVKVTP